MYGKQLNGKGHYVPLDSSLGQSHTSEDVYDDSRAVYQMNLLQVIRRRLWLIVLVVVVVQGLAVGFTFLQTPLYTASIKVLIDARGGDEYVGEPANVLGLESLTATLAELVATRPIAQDAIQKLDSSMPADSLLDNLSAEQVEDTQLIEVSYTNSNPQEAQRIANAVGAVFSDRVAQGDLGGGGGTAQVVETATLPTSPTSPDPLRNIALALAAGLMLGVTLACLLDYVDDNWRSPDEVERVSGVPNLGIIPTLKIPKNERRGHLE